MSSIIVTRFAKKLHMIFDTISFKCVAEVVAISIGSIFTKKSILDATSCRKETEHAKCAIKKGFCTSSHIFLLYFVSANAH